MFYGILYAYGLILLCIICHAVVFISSRESVLEMNRIRKEEIDGFTLYRRHQLRRRRPWPNVNTGMASTSSLANASSAATQTLVLRRKKLGKDEILPAFIAATYCCSLCITTASKLNRKFNRPFNMTFWLKIDAFIGYSGS